MNSDTSGLFIRWSVMWMLWWVLTEAYNETPSGVAQNIPDLLFGKISVCVGIYSSFSRL